MIFISSLCPFFIKLHDHASVVADCNDSNISSNTTELETASIQMFGLSPLRSGKWRQLTWPLALCIVQLMELWILIRFEHYLTYFLLFHFFLVWIYLIWYWSLNYLIFVSWKGNFSTFSSFTPCTGRQEARGSNIIWTGEVLS